MRYVGTAVVALALFTTAPTHADVYKWKDKDGNVVFSQTPPPGQKAEAITPRYAKQPGGQATGNVAATPATTPADEGAAPAKTEELTADQIAKKTQNCTNAQKQIADMNSDRNNRLQYTNEQGELAFITPELQQARLSEAQAMAKKYCE